METVSVVIPCRNACDTIGACLEALGRQTIKPLEVIVVDDSSTDGSGATAARRGGTVINSDGPPSAGQARNTGKARARADIVAFIDADAVACDDWIERILLAFQRYPDAAGVGGAVIDGSHDIAGRCEYLSNFSEYAIPKRPGPVSTIPTINVAYRREAIRGIDFIPTTAGEDTMFNAELAARGGTLILDPSIRVTHIPARRGLLAFFRNQYRCGRAFVYPRVRHPLRGRVLLRHPFLLLFLPRLGVLFTRYLFSRKIIFFILLSPILAVGEVCRSAGILKQRKVERYGKD